MVSIDKPRNALSQNETPQNPLERKRVSLWPPKVWPVLRYSAAPRRTIVGALAAGVVGAIVLGSPGIGYPITAAVIRAVAAYARPERLTPWHAAGAVAVLALSSVAVFRAADWLVTMSVWLAVFVAATVLSSTWSWTGLLLGSSTPILLPARVLRWTTRGTRRLNAGQVRLGRVALVGVVTALLVVVFAALFAGADPAFGRIIDQATPEWDLGAAIGRIFVFFMVTAGALAASYLAINRPRFDDLRRPSRTTVRLWEWMVPVGALVVLFGAFVAVQIATLFGGQAHVRTTDGLTNAEYARQGFWQLLAVTVLTLLVLAVTIRNAPRVSGSDRTALRLLLGVLCMLSLVIVGSALHRMSLYEEQYGYTTLRVFVTAVELWLGSVFVLLMATGVRMSGRWLPRAVGVSAVLTVLALAVISPDAYIARQNVDRFEMTGKIDSSYLARLSADATAELDRLPEPYRSCVLGSAVSGNSSWHEFNLADWQARRIVVEQRQRTCADHAVR